MSNKNTILLFFLIIVCAFVVVGRVEFQDVAYKPQEKPSLLAYDNDRSFEKKMDLMRYVLEQNHALNIDDALVIAAAIVDACEQYNLDIAVVCAILKTESGFNPAAVGKNKRDIGIGQINLKYWQQHLNEAGLIRSADDLMQPHINIHAAAYILRYYLDMHGSLDRAIIAYNGRTDYLPKVKNNL